VRITRINPADLHAPPGYHHLTIVEPGRMAYLAGQCPLHPDGTCPPADRLDMQIEQVAHNCLIALAAAGAQPGDVVRAVIYVVSSDRQELSATWIALVDSALGQAFSSAVTLLGVAQLGYPDQRIEIDLTAAL
jgi:enamine deaminase RidA (YjgF/YER057c/UK114 family)